MALRDGCSVVHLSRSPYFATIHTVAVYQSMFHRLLIGRGLVSFGRVYSGFQRRAVGAVKLHSSPDTQAIKRKPQLATVECCAATPERGVEQMNPATLISAATEGNALIAPDCLMMLPLFGEVRASSQYRVGKTYLCSNLARPSNTPSTSL